ncbi:hypothetical protein C3942_07880 [Solimonas fluminis]|uniref:Leucine-rich repeat domain-containing protein n=1 Tax=Solimonas fluminis TaxID=2086571 RepID=A0A2S5TI64_9GAMM|nr:hypothetical protein [Solimonas fluminis]PPE74670.1 hypothetical protein C3942_07880 [Solimonas fluminis]
MSRLDFVRDSSKRFPIVDTPDSVLRMRIWHCKYRTLSPLSAFQKLEELIIASFPDETLEVIGELRSLRYLRLLHLPKITDLSPLGRLQNLEVLSLATSPAWDAAGRIQRVGSLAPLRSMQNLRHLELFGVCTEDRSLAEIEECHALRTASFSQYPKEKVKRFSEKLGVTNQYAPASSFEA